MRQATIALLGNKRQLSLENNSGVFSTKKIMNYHKEKTKTKLLYFSSCQEIISLSQTEHKILLYCME